MIGTCIDKIYKGKKIVGYKIKFNDGSIETIESAQLKNLMSQGIVHIYNLKFTMDGKLIDTRNDWTYSNKFENADKELGLAKEEFIRKLIRLSDNAFVCNFVANRRNSSGDGYASVFYAKFDTLKDKQLYLMDDYISTNIPKVRSGEQGLFKPNPYGDNLSAGTLKCNIEAIKDNIGSIKYNKYKFNVTATYASNMDVHKVVEEEKLEKILNRVAQELYKCVKSKGLSQEDFNECMSWITVIVIYSEIIKYKLNLNIKDKIDYTIHLINKLVQKIDGNTSNKIINIVSSMVKYI